MKNGGWVRWRHWTENGLVAFGQMPLRDVGRELQKFEAEAIKILKETGADHVLYGVKEYVHPVLRSYQAELQGFFQESRNPIWQPYRQAAEGDSDIRKWGDFDFGRFSELELRMYSLIKAGIATKSELDEAYTLDEALKLYALYSMDRDIERFQAEEMQAEMGR